MNCPSRVDETWGHEGWNQSPSALAADITTRQDLNGLANSRQQRNHSRSYHADEDGGNGKNRMLADDVELGTRNAAAGDKGGSGAGAGDVAGLVARLPSSSEATSPKGAPAACTGRSYSAARCPSPPPPPSRSSGRSAILQACRRAAGVLRKYVRFIGPGFLVSVAYIDPGNYSTDVAAGATFRFRLLFIILMSNLFAIFLQSLCIKLGTVTGLNLAEHCRAHLPRWLNIVLYLFGEAAIIATDIAEVIGSAIALNLLLRIPLIAGCAITLVDVLVILFFYDPGGSMRRLRAFECFVILLVLGVVVSFCIQLSYITDTTVGEVFRGYLPSSTIVKAKGLYLSCGILGATVMPHSLYLGSGIVQARLRDFDQQASHAAGDASASASAAAADQPRPSSASSVASDPEKYRPSLAAIRFCFRYSVVELAVSLFTFALFVNSSILVVAGAALYEKGGAEAEDADLFAVHRLLSRTLAPVAGTIFALALLLSGVSAGIVCTISGQILSEGALRWTLRPWLRRLVTRAISIVPSIIIAAAVGRAGLGAALTASQVALSVILPFVSAPVIYFTCRSRYMTVASSNGGGGGASGGGTVVNFRNHWFTAAFALVLWLVVTTMNVALLVLLALGKA